MEFDDRGQRSSSCRPIVAKLARGLSLVGSPSFLLCILALHVHRVRSKLRQDQSMDSKWKTGLHTLQTAQLHAAEKRISSRKKAFCNGELSSSRSAAVHCTDCLPSAILFGSLSHVVQDELMTRFLFFALRFQRGERSFSRFVDEVFAPHATESQTIWHKAAKRLWQRALAYGAFPCKNGWRLSLR